MVIKKKNKEVPILVKVISVLNYIIGGILIILGFIILFSAGVNSIVKGIDIGFFTLGLLVLLPGILSLFLGWGLWSGKNWARITEIVFSLIGVVLIIGDISKGNFLEIYGIVLPSLVAGYLFFSKEVKESFK